ncbi:MAG: hypothetical protein HY697_03725 [Deltaproteobacteria bacterium]|nr:hypothetical protein [Deltaproteobacteria bacterium]
MGRRDGDDDREKLSWREIDRMRDRSRHGSESRPSLGERRLRSDWAKKQHLKEAEKFFQGKKGTAAYKEAHMALHEQYGTAEFAGAAIKFHRQFGLPDEWGSLLLFLDLPEPRLVGEALRAMKELYPKRGLLEQKGFKGKLRVLAMTSHDKNLRRECEEILEELT